MINQRLWTISDVHIDYGENKDALLGMSDTDFTSDMLIIAGDATDDLISLESFLGQMRVKFSELAFVPGNHELWLTKTSGHKDSVEKFHAILSLCRGLDIKFGPLRFGSNNAVWVIPLLSWYHTPEYKERTLYMEKEGFEDRTAKMWGDFSMVKFPDEIASDPVSYFIDQNQQHATLYYDAPVVTFSHFLPRQELIMSTEEERSKSSLVYKDLNPEFNFSHVAGTRQLDEQIRGLNSRLHIYGHQHRNRLRHIDGVTYVSHCMGYPKERRIGVVAEHAVKPLEIWNTEQGFMV